MDVLVGQIGLGFNPLDAITSAAKSAAQVAADPRFQRAAATTANAYYPEQYAQVQQGVQQAKQVLRTNDIHYQQLLQRNARQPRPMPMQPMMPMPPQQFDDDGAPMASGTVQHGNILMIGGAVAAGLLLLFALRK